MWREVGERVNDRPRLHLAAQLPESSCQCIGDSLRTTGRDGPAVGVGRCGERQPERRRERAVQRQHRVRRAAAEQSGSLIAFEPTRQERGGLERANTEPGDGDRVPRNREEWAEQLRNQIRPTVDERLHQPAPRRPVGFEAGRRFVDTPVQHTGTASVERMSQRYVGPDPSKAVLGERLQGERRRCNAEGVDGGADVVDVAGQGQLSGSCATADLVRCLEHEHRATELGEAHCGGEPVRPRPHDDGVVVRRSHAGWPDREAPSNTVAPSRAASTSMSWPTRIAPLDRCDLGIGALRVVVEQQQPPGAGSFGQGDGVVDSGVTVVNSKWKFAGGVLGVVDHQVDVATEIHRCLVVRPEAVGAGADLGRPVIREVGDGARLITDAVPHGAAAGVGDLTRQHGESLDRVHAFVDRVERP